MNAPTLRSLVALVAVLSLHGNPGGMKFAATADGATATIVGFATYRERIALPRGAAFEATLEEGPRPDGPGETIARVRDDDPGSVPIAFEIPFDTRRLDPRRTYVVRASLFAEGRIWFTGTESYRLPAQDQRNRITVLMQRASSDESAPDRERDRRVPETLTGTLPATFVAVLPCADCKGIRHQINLLPDGAFMESMTYFRAGHDETSYALGAWSLSRDGRTLTLDDDREGSTWTVRNWRTLRKVDQAGRRTDSRRPHDLTRRAGYMPMEPRVTLEGMFRYMADAPRFRDCRSGLQFPVAMGDDYRALERAYAGRRARPGSELLVSIEGRIEERLGMEGDQAEPFLVVEQFVRATPGQDCEKAAPAPAGGIEDSRWRPVRIGDRPVVPGQAREPWIMLESRAKHAEGFGGCNGFSGGYELRGQTLRFGSMIRTQMACPTLDTENAFLRALEETRRYRLRAPRTLELLDQDGRVLARLEERSLR